MTRLLLLAALLGGFTPLSAPAQTVVPPIPAVAAPFADEIAAFEAADKMAMPAPGGVLFLGSSSIRFWSTLVEDFPGVPVINRGFGGSLIADSLRYFDRIVLPYAPRTIVFYAGDNDIAAGRLPEQVLADFHALVVRVRAKLPETRILFIAIKPSIQRWAMVDRIREANRLVQAYAATSPTLGFIDIFPAMLGPDSKPRPDLLRADGLHMTPAGYAIWRGAVAPYLKP
ncbi:hypothetical protein IAG41_20605 [Sphingomonas sp. JC676]|uniref:SGNH/GDSL hydrolase family protein n=1 Tax=Sphingomonas sp. JC676 TaxID=2768065 RepID=UPI00165835BE|nr:SGNH/GDSL hydrolase family protein [Sphingomonas sp. JC676]MBC9034799.1 hypothetical protein [Sphingomonas sp. JC676]